MHLIIGRGIPEIKGHGIGGELAGIVTQFQKPCQLITLRINASDLAFISGVNAFECIARNRQRALLGFSWFIRFSGFVLRLYGSRFGSDATQ